MNAKTKKNADSKHEYVSGRKGQTFLQVARGETENREGRDCLWGRFHRHLTQAIAKKGTISPTQAAQIASRVCSECLTIAIDLPNAARIYNEELEGVRNELMKAAESLTLKVEV